MLEKLKKLFTKEKIVEKIVIKKEKVLVKAFSLPEKEDFATIWKNNSKLISRLEDAVVYYATIKYVENKREKELVEMVAKIQNGLMAKFYDEFQARMAKHREQS